MKKLLLILAACAVLTSCNSCESIKKIWSAGTVSVSAQTADKIIIDAQKAAQIGETTFNTFLKLEYDNRDAYMQISPEIHKKAEWLREKVPDPTQIILPGEPPTISIPRGVAILKVERKATKIFQANRTEDGKANLMTAYRTLMSTIDDVKRIQSLALAGGNP